MKRSNLSGMPSMRLSSTLTTFLILIAFGCGKRQVQVSIAPPPEPNWAERKGPSDVRASAVENVQAGTMPESKVVVVDIASAPVPPTARYSDAKWERRSVYPDNGYTFCKIAKWDVNVFGYTEFYQEPFDDNHGHYAIFYKWVSIGDVIWKRTSSVKAHIEILEVLNTAKQKCASFSEAFEVKQVLGDSWGWTYMHGYVSASSPSGEASKGDTLTVSARRPDSVYCDHRVVVNSRSDAGGDFGLAYWDSKKISLNISAHHHGGIGSAGAHMDVTLYGRFVQYRENFSCSRMPGDWYKDPYCHLRPRQLADGSFMFMWSKLTPLNGCVVVP